MSKVTDDLRDALESALSAGISEESMKNIKSKVTDILCEIESDIDYRIKEDLAPNLAAFVVEMAEKTVDAILCGDEDAMRRFLSCQNNGGWNGRSDGYNSNRSIVDQHPVIHGKLFEQGCIALRKSIAVAHREIISSERILDLEDQVASLVAQLNKKSDQLEQMRDRYVA